MHNLSKLSLEIENYTMSSSLYTRSISVVGYSVISRGCGEAEDTSRYALKQLSLIFTLVEKIFYIKYWGILY